MVKIKSSDGRYGNEEVEQVFFEEALDKLLHHQHHTPRIDNSSDTESSERVITTKGRYDLDEDEHEEHPDCLFDEILALCEEEIMFYDSEHHLCSADSETDDNDPKIVLNDFVKKHIKRIAVKKEESITPQEKIMRLVRDFTQAYLETKKLAASKLPSSQLHDLKKDLYKTLEEIGMKYLEAMHQDEAENTHTHVAAVIEYYNRKLEDSLDIIKYTRRNKLYFLNERADEATKIINQKLNSFVESLGNVVAWAKKTFTLENIVSTMDTLSTRISATFASITSWVGEKWNRLTHKNIEESEYIPSEEVEVLDLQTHKVERMFAFKIDDRSFGNSLEDETLTDEIYAPSNKASEIAGISTTAMMGCLAEKKRTIINVELETKGENTILDKPLDLEIERPKRTGLSKITHWVSEKFHALIGGQEDEEYIPSEEFEMALAADKPITQAPRMFALHLSSETSEYMPEDDDVELSSECANTEEIVGNLHLFDHSESVRAHKSNPSEAASIDAIVWKAMPIDHD